MRWRAAAGSRACDRERRANGSLNTSTRVLACRRVRLRRSECREARVVEAEGKVESVARRQRNDSFPMRYTRLHYSSESETNH